MVPFRPSNFSYAQFAVRPCLLVPSKGDVDKLDVLAIDLDVLRTFPVTISVVAKINRSAGRNVLMVLGRMQELVRIRRNRFVPRVPKMQ